MAWYNVKVRMTRTRKHGRKTYRKGTTHTLRRKLTPKQARTRRGRISARFGYNVLSARRIRKRR